MDIYATRTLPSTGSIKRKQSIEIFQTSAPKYQGVVAADKVTDNYLPIKFSAFTDAWNVNVGVLKKEKRFNSHTKIQHCLKKFLKINQKKSIQSITMLGHQATANKLKIIHQSESAQITSNIIEKFIELQLCNSNSTRKHTSDR